MSDAFAAPMEGETAVVEVNPEDAVPSILVRIAGLGIFIAGVLTATTGLQLALFLYLWWSIIAVILILAALGVANMIMGAMIGKGRAWAAMAGTALAVAQALFLVGWNIYALSSAILSPLGILALAAAVPAAIAAGLCIPACLKVTAARNALYEA